MVNNNGTIDADEVTSSGVRLEQENYLEKVNEITDSSYRRYQNGVPFVQVILELQEELDTLVVNFVESEIERVARESDDGNYDIYGDAGKRLGLDSEIIEEYMAVVAGWDPGPPLVKGWYGYGAR